MRATKQSRNQNSCVFIRCSKDLTSMARFPASRFLSHASTAKGPGSLGTPAAALLIVHKHLAASTCHVLRKMSRAKDHRPASFRSSSETFIVWCFSMCRKLQMTGRLPVLCLSKERSQLTRLLQRAWNTFQATRLDGIGDLVAFLLLVH